MLHTGHLYFMDIGVVPHPIVPVSYQGRCLQPACNETSGHNIGGGSLVGSSQRQHLLSLLAEGRPELATMLGGCSLKSMEIDGNSMKQG